MTGSKKSLISINGPIKNKIVNTSKTRSLFENKGGGSIEISKYVRSVKSSMTICYHHSGNAPSNHRKKSNIQTILHHKPRKRKHHVSKTNRKYIKNQSKAKKKIYGHKKINYNAKPDIKKILMFTKNRIKN